MYYFCTYFDTNYISRALCLLESLQRHCSSFLIYMLCMDESTFDRMNSLKNKNIMPIKLSRLESYYNELLSLKKSRSKIEYYYTCGPSFIKYIMDNFINIDIITYLDADLYFFHDPKPLFDQFQGYSIGVIAHQLPEFRKNNIWQGIYNVGWISFKRDKNGLACLEWWRERCIEWCYERYEDGKYADQLYLDQWPKLFQGFKEFTNHGANVAAWNVRNYKFSYRNNTIYVDNDPLIFYHFHGFKKVTNNIYNTNLGISLRTPPNVLKKCVFIEYIRKLNKYSSCCNPTPSIRIYRRKFQIFKDIIRLFLGIIFRQYILVIKNRIY